ncbi:MAG: hypothetical protein HY744_19410 [Deltaproteobacteria bacterium]|nr:hypothetical protein [Deltaproteobacteria bacterium]
MSFRFDGTGGAVRTIPVADLGTYKGARQWLGMLVRVEKVRLICSPYESSSGRYSIGFSAGQDDVPCDELPSVTNELFDLKGAGPPLAQGDELAAVTGIVTYFYGVHIAPRSAADIEP